MEMPQIYRPVPRRNLEMTPSSDSTPPSPNPENTNPELLLAQKPDNFQLSSRTRSVLNLTSSTLLGIYSEATDGGREELNTPWGTGAQTPAQRLNADVSRPDPQTLKNALQPPRAFHKAPRKGFKRYYVPLFVQTLSLFGFGIAFGLIIAHLHRTQQITPVPLPTTTRSSWYYQIYWGILGVIIGNLVPRIDALFEEDDNVLEIVDNYSREGKHARTVSSTSSTDHDRGSMADNGLGPLWHSTVRSIGAFVGIIFALRRVPWQSTLQVSLTLAVANPVLWYLIDRSKSGFALSTLISFAGTFLSLLLNPDFVPVPAIHQTQASEKFGVYIWLSSILFCTSLCFGAIGRRLQL